MKKLLIFLTIFFSFLFIDNVKAYNTTYITSDFVSDDMIIDYNTISNLPYVNQNVLANFETKLSQLFDNTQYNYIITLKRFKDNSNSAPEFHVYYFDKSSSVPVYLNFSYSYYKSKHSLYATFQSPLNTNIGYAHYWYSLGSSNNNYTFNAQKYYGSSRFNEFFAYVFSNNGTNFNQVGNTNFAFSTYFYRTNYSLRFYSSITGESINNFYLTDSSNNSNKLVLNNDIFLDSNLNMPLLTPPTPILSFSTTNNYDSLNNITSVDIRLNVSNYTSNYYYQYQKGGTSGTWTTLQLEEYQNSGNYYFEWNNWTENTTIYVRVVDSSSNFITTATLTIDTIYNYENVSSVIDLGSNHYAYFSNYVLVQNVKSTTENNLVSILCESNRPFENGFCSLFYNDLISDHSNINYFNDTTFAFHTLFGDANNILVSDKYYVFNFRVLKPFVPDISNVVLSTNYGDINLSNNFDKVYYNDGGSYIDYALVFNTNNIILDSSYNLNSISVYFNIPLINYYYDNIPDSFTFSIYRAFKLSYYDSIPDSNEISNLFSINNLSSIDGVNSQHLFFTDTTFNTYGFGGIISAPFRLLYALEDYDICSDITIPFPHSNQNLTLKCVRSSIPAGINPLITILQIVLSGIICYRIAVSTLALIKQVLNPSDTGIEVLDL